MIRVIKHKHGQDGITVSIDAKSWEAASEAILFCHDNQPEGYQLIGAQIVRRGRNGGRRCQVRFILRHSNQRSPRITQVEAKLIFERESEIASTPPEIDEPADQAEESNTD